ncbi:uncharacterized protein K452DRAFT_356242 [Aplosporella prunicola CBS 121167]|uniref:Uncharacterized protein n=1 Tax=Aplosporella prunicola CBS 121167 TaxID=1176127 RepID=A0A6A6BL87_9PEZI|nr:uncharacterized protein K452DRAFT_356242 [Aplosporella prunicola CBS 121167]KAF2144882.1 hypothetical protein K452DRAFT_356242 [Aplosporella prunicola CBS 121167]
MSRYLSAQESLFVDDGFRRYHDTHRPYIIEEEDEYNDAAPPVPVPRYRDYGVEDFRDQVRKRASLPLSRPKTCLYRSTDSIVSKCTSFHTNGAGIIYRSEIETVPTLTRTPWEQNRGSRKVISAPIQQPVRRPRGFQRLPKEVYDCILRQLEVLHFGKGSRSCTTCYLQDVYNVGLVGRAWDKAARAQLYTSLWMPPPDQNESKWPLARKASRLKLLRKTLRERSALAKQVREIKAAELQHVFVQSSYKEQQELVNELASVVMACPKLERLVGFHWAYNHDFDRLNHALSTRTQLRERAWIIAAPVDAQPAARRALHHHHAAFELYPGPTELFLHHHDHAAQLRTLLLHGQSSGTMNFRAFVATFRKLPQLQHLHISNFAPDDFNDRTLAAVPPLRALRLEDCPGVTDKGLMRYAASPAAAPLRSLLLIRQEVIDLLVLMAFFKNLTRLERFSIVQDSSPGVHPGIHIRRPVFASLTLEFLHWDVLIPGPATQELSISVRQGAFPALRTIRAPADHDGRLQDLCRPVAGFLPPPSPTSPTSPLTKTPSDPSRADSAHAPSAAKDEEDDDDNAHYARSLPHARRAAQQRIAHAAATLAPAMRVVVEDADAHTIETVFDIRGYMGTVGSRITYSLEPDIAGSEEAVVEVEDLLCPPPVVVAAGEGTEAEEALCVGCAFAGWSTAARDSGPGAVGRRSAGGWLHAPRERVRVVEVMDFF